MSNNARAKRSQIQTGTGLIGLLLVLLGLLGFVPGITQPFHQLRLATDASTAQIFGLFQTSILHNLLHLGTGAAGLICSRTPLRAQKYLLWTGIGYLVLFLYGIVVFRRQQWDLLPIDNPDNALHLALGATMIACSVLLDCGPGWAKVVRQGKATI